MFLITLEEEYVLMNQMHPVYTPSQTLLTFFFKMMSLSIKIFIQKQLHFLFTLHLVFF